MGIIVVGGGQAGASLVCKLRSSGYEGDVTLVCDEPTLPYQRPPLSKGYLLGEMEKERLYLRPDNWYGENNINVRMGEAASDLDPSAKTLRVGNDTLSFDQLALTTGSLPNRLPKDIGGSLPGVHVVRTIADIDALAPEVQPGRRALIVGGGYIGLEAAAVISKKGGQVTLVEKTERILSRVAAPVTSDFFRMLHQAAGVDIRENCGLERLDGDARVARAFLSDGTSLDVDYVVVGTGIRPDDRLAASAGVDVDNGILVNEFGQTSAPGIWAAGDCTSFSYLGHQLRLESVQNAIDQAEVVAANMLGELTPYIPKPWFWSDQYDVKLQIAGLSLGYDSVIPRVCGPLHVQSHWYYKEDKLVSVAAMNAPRDYMIGKRMIEAGKTPPVLAVANPETDLKAYL